MKKQSNTQTPASHSKADSPNNPSFENRKVRPKQKRSYIAPSSCRLNALEQHETKRSDSSYARVRSEHLLIQEKWPEGSSSLYANAMRQSGSSLAISVREDGMISASSSASAACSSQDLSAPLSSGRSRLDPFEARESLQGRITASKTDWIHYSYTDGCVCMECAAGNRKEKATSLQAWLNLRCLKAGSSLLGRRQAAARLLDARKFLPVLVSLKPLEIWIPHLKTEDGTIIWFSLAQIESITRVAGAEKNRSRIRFRDGLEIEIGEGRQAERNFLQAVRLKHLVYSSQSSQ